MLPLTLLLIALLLSVCLSVCLSHTHTRRLEAITCHQQFYFFYISLIYSKCSLLAGYLSVGISTCRLCLLILFDLELWNLIVMLTLYTNGKFSAVESHRWLIGALLQSARSLQLTIFISDINKDWICKDKDKDKDQAYKDQDKD